MKTIRNLNQQFSFIPGAFYLILLLLGMNTNAQPIPSYIPTNGLVGWWPFNGNANDESGNGNHGSTNGASLTTDRFNISNQAYGFDGLVDYIDITSTNGLSSTQGLSMSLWFLWNGPNGVDNHQYLFLIGDNPNGGITVTDLGQLAVNVLNCNCPNDIDPVSSISPNFWYNVVLTYELSQGLLKMYLNGVLIDSTQENMFSYYTTNNSGDRFGHYHFNSHYFNGKLDDAGLWNRALTQQEVSALFTACPLAINIQPNSQTVNLNSNVDFIVAVNDPNASYQWQTDLGSGFQNLSNAGQYSGANNDTLSISNVNLLNNNQLFRCITTAGSCADTSNVAVLNVNSCPLVILNQPVTQTSTLGNQIQFTVVTNDPNASYQWQSDLGIGFQNLSNAGQYSGTNDDTLSVSNLNLLNNNQLFRCIITSGSCADTSTVAVLNVNSCPLAILNQPVSQMSTLGNNIQFTIGTNDPNATYQWQSDLGLGYQNLSDAGQYSGVTNDSLTVSNVSLINNNQYFRCIIQSIACSDTDTSSVAVLSVNNMTSVDTYSQSNALHIFPNPAKDHITIHYGNLAMMSGYRVKIENTLGQVVYQNYITHPGDYLDISNWGGDGLYLLSIADLQGNIVETKKIRLQ
jgi:hypothetical protein